ncbi:MAG: PLP-dependent aminotransferase family protein, partial [Ktedonobacterales bacterium]
FIEAGELERHLARVRRAYRARRDALVAALRDELGEIVQIGPAEAGIHLLALLPPGTDDVALTERARAEGLAIAPLSPHYQSQPRPGLLLGFGAMGEEQLAEGVRRLAPLAREAARLTAGG